MEGVQVQGVGVQVTTVAGTPCSFLPVAADATLDDLEFPRVLDHVARRAVSAVGAARVRTRRPLADLPSIRAELGAVAEYAHALTTLDAVTPEATADINNILMVLGRQGSVLEPEPLRRLGEAMGAMRVNADVIERAVAAAPSIAGLRSDVPSLGLVNAIARAIGPDHVVTDGASPDVKQTRRRLRDTRDRLVKQLERFARGLPSEFRVEGGGVTVRDGRFVVPVRREARGRIGGLIHGESTSGATVFFEPTEAVEGGNALRTAEAEERRAVLQLLRDLTDRVREESDSIRDGWEMSVRLDDLYARARSALDMHAVLPTVEEAGTTFAVSEARHPLVQGESGAVPFDLTFDDGQRTLIVSGPNAGGKTVLLKAVGLLSCMAQSGVMPSIGKPSRLPVFRRIHTDIGDHQSIEANLSTFSAHLEAMRAILADADPESLVLLDEVGSGTDPMEGAAIAGSVLAALNERAGMTIATTHLNQLKELAASTPGMVNASLEFDTDTLTPTYRLQVGKPGRSYGIAIARRLGLDAAVIDEAERRLPEAVRSFDAALADLERREQEVERRELESEAARVRENADRVHLEGERADLDARRQALEKAERELERNGREKARQFLLESRKRVEEALGLARAAVDEATAKEARRLVEEGVSGEAAALERLEQKAREKGWKMRGGTGGLDTKQTTGSPPRRSDRSVDTQQAVAGRAQSEIDLRGMRVDEAEAALVAALDAAVVAELSIVRLIHGKGTGALRSAVHSILQTDPRVRGYADAPVQQGGTGATVVELTD